MLILLFSAYMSFKFLKRIKKNRFVLNLKNYLKETSNVLTNYIRFNLYGILFTALVLVPTLYIIGINSYYNSINLLSLSLFKEHSGLFVGFGTGILLYVFMSLFVLHKVYYRALKEVNKAIKNLDAE
jgi:predicted PurR-regulated permease PerM